MTSNPFNHSTTEVIETVDAQRSIASSEWFQKLIADIREDDALIVVDMQNDFCPGGSLAVSGGNEIIPLINELIIEFLKRGRMVVKSRDWHPRITRHFAEFGGPWPVHCVQNSQGAEFHPHLVEDNNGILIVSKGLGDKDDYSAFHAVAINGETLESVLTADGVKRAWVVGLATDYCVKFTVLVGLDKGFAIKVIKPGMRAVNIQPGDGEKALAEMAAAGAEIVS
jgi:nicotinamidase/pyrazinamidase